MKQVKIGVVGLGRLGMCHCENLLGCIPGAKIVAACNVIPEELEKARTLGIENLYDNYEKMLAEIEADAVVLSTPTTLHASHIISALENGFHVFCEKPLALNTKDCQTVVDKAVECRDRIVQIGFVRRFDAAYKDAYKRIQEGQIGNVYRIHSHTSDWTEFAAFQVKFSQSSGGIFHDYNIHDIDLIHWLAGSRFENVFCTGGSYKYPEFDKMGSADNTFCLAKLKNGGIATISASRTEPHGHGTHTIVYGTEGILNIGLEPSATRLQIVDQHGVRQECVKTFYERFKDAFIEELRIFVDCVKEGDPSPIPLADSMEATKVAVAMTESFEKKCLVSII